MEIIKFENFKSDIPQGWINVKLDNQLYKRMNRYVYTLDKIVGTRYKYDLYKKIDSISNIDRHIDDPNLSIQSKISIITILQYLKEIRLFQRGTIDRVGQRKRIPLIRACLLSPIKIVEYEKKRCCC